MGDLFTIITNIADDITAFDFLLTVLIFIFGLVMIILGLMRLSRMSQGAPTRSQSIAGPLVTILIGFFFIGWISTLQMTSQTFLGDDTIKDASEIFAYAPVLTDFAADQSGFGNRAGMVLVALTYIIQFFGLIAVVRSFFLFNETAQGTGQSRLGAAFTFLISGTMAFNFPLFLGILESTIT